MMNVLTLAGALLLLGGALLVLLGFFRAVRGVFRRHSYRKRPLQVEGQGIWSGAVTAREVYVPGTIARSLGLVVLGLLLAGGGLCLGWAGLALGGPFTSCSEPVPLATVTFEGGQVRRVETTGGESVVGDLAGSIYVARTETIEFRGPLASLGLGHYARLVSIGGYSGPAAVLERKGRILPVGERHLLYRIAGRLAKWQPDWVRVEDRVSGPLRNPGATATVIASRDGVEWRP